MERTVKVNDAELSIEVDEMDGEHYIWIDGIEWVRTPNRVHAAVLFHMICDHIGEYMNFAKI